jgi:hypothetical protein
VRDADGATLGCPVDGAGTSSSRAALPTSGGPAAHPEQERERAGAPPAHFIEAQAEQELWQELRDHGASLNQALNEVLRIHSGPRVAHFSGTCLLVELCDSSPFVAFAPVLLLSGAHWSSFDGGRNWRTVPGEGMTPSTR